MPLYLYKCEHCENTFEKVLPLKEYKEKPDCPECGWQSKKIMALGGIQDDNPVWIDRDLIKQLQDIDNPNIRPISSRTDYNKYLRDNGLVAG